MIRFSLPCLSFAGSVLAACLSGTPAMAAAVTIALVAPTDGPFALLGQQMLQGAEFQADGRGSKIIPIRETCEDTDADNLAKEIMASGAEAAIGFLCTESLSGTLGALAAAHIPVVTLSVRSDILMEDAMKYRWPFFRLVPNAGSEATRLTDVILTRWKNQPLALIDDGTIHGRELVEAVRTALAAVGMTPVFSDTFRPAQEQQISLVRRLGKSGATHVLVGADRTDTAIIARDAGSEGVDLTLLGGEALKAPDDPVPLQNGVLAVALPDDAGVSGGQETVAAMKAAGIVPEGYVLPAFAAVSLMEQAKDQAAKDGSPLADALLKGTYATIIGPIRFNGGHELAESPYRLLEWRDGRFVTAPDAP